MGKSNKELEADVVIIGTGASGLCAALTAGLGGGKVIIFEKMPDYGGMTNYALGMFGIETKRQKREKIGITAEEAFKRHVKNCHWLADGRLVRAFMDKTASTIDWLEELGVEFEGLDSYAPNGPRVWHPIKGFAGNGLIKPLLRSTQAEKTFNY